MTTVIEEGVVSLNSNRYRIIGGVTKRLINQSPVRSWYIKDLTNGMGKLERKSARDDKYCWWNECQIDHAGHIIPPPPATAGTFSTWTDPTGNIDPAIAWANEVWAYNNNTADAATTTVAIPATSWSSFVEFTHASLSCKGIRIWAAVAGADAGDQIDIDVFYGGAYVHLYSGTFTRLAWNIYTLGAQAITKVQIRLYNGGGGAQTGSIYEVDFMTTPSDAITTLTFCNFNSQLYCGRNRILYKLDTTAGSDFREISPAGGFTANITDLISTIKNATPLSTMAILLGDDAFFYCMTTTEVFTQTDEAGAHKGVDWNSRFYWINSTGSQISYCTLMAAVIAETDNGSIPRTVTVVGLDTYQDAAGNSVIYCRTNGSVWAHNATAATFLEINIRLVNKSSTAKGGLTAMGGYLITHGLQLIKYTAGNYNAVIDTKMGLDGLDGVPSEVNAEMVYLTRGIGFVYALFDSTQINATGYSWVGKLNEITGAWSCFWKTGTVNQNMHSGIVSDVYARRLWFDCGGSLYYIPIPITNLFPKLVSTSTYATGVSLYTPWFESDSSTLARTQAEVITYARGVTTEETITIYCRTNRSNMDMATGWGNALVTLDTAAENGRIVTTLASGAGVEFNAIQFKITLARTTSTNAPDLQGMEIKYIDNVAPKWSYSFVIDVSQDFEITKEAMYAALAAVATSTTLVPFQYHDRSAEADTYVKVAPITGDLTTGEAYKGIYSLTVFEP